MLSRIIPPQTTYAICINNLYVNNVFNYKPPVSAYYFNRSTGDYVVTVPISSINSIFLVSWEIKPGADCIIIIDIKWL